MASVPKAVQPSIASASDSAVETAEDVVDTVEEIFSPRPDGVIARHHAMRAQREAAEKQQENINERLEERSFKAVKTAELAPESVSYQTLIIPPFGRAMLLPSNPYRKSANVFPTYSGATSILILCKNEPDCVSCQAANITDASTVPFPGLLMSSAFDGIKITHRAQVWAYNPNGAGIMVAVASEFYAPETLV